MCIKVPALPSLHSSSTQSELDHNRLKQTEAERKKEAVFPLLEWLAPLHVLLKRIESTDDNSEPLQRKAQCWHSAECLHLSEHCPQFS